MIAEAINELKKYTLGRKNTEKIEISVLALNRIIFALEEQNPILDKMRAEFISLYPKNYAGDLEFGGMLCKFSLNKVLETIDKYKTESEEEE